jgi:phospho-N-acetylmuramoyl-pentapeptide-transferase
VLYHLLYPLHEIYGWLNVFKYQTFRAMLAFLISFIFVLLIEPVFIRRLQSRGIKGQPIRDDGPKVHEVKRGTPTMGGLVIVLAVLFSSLLLADLRNYYVWLSLAMLVCYAGIGFIDDWRKITQQNSKGLSERGKMLLMTGVSLVGAWSLYNEGFSTTLSVPFLKELSFVMGVLFIPFAVLVVVGTSNAVNLTDGLDGLAIGPVMTVSATYAIFAYLSGHAGHADYLGIAHIPGSGELAIVLASLTAAGLGFLWYNTFPAQVFMGDTGALAMGGLLGFASVVVKQELVLIIAGGIFVLEALSVLIQRYSFKLTGKRVFKMAPIHHHFELKGWAEPKIIVRFWIISIVLALIALTSLKLR